MRGEGWEGRGDGWDVRGEEWKERGEGWEVRGEGWVVRGDERVGNWVWARGGGCEDVRGLNGIGA